MIKRINDDFAVSDEWIIWYDNTGTHHTKQGIIELHIRSGYSSALIIYNGRCFTLGLAGKITKRGLVRIAKKWAKEIWEK